MKTFNLILLCVGMIAMLGFFRYLYSDPKLTQLGGPTPLPPSGAPSSPTVTRDHPVLGHESRYTSKDKSGRTQFEIHARNIVFQDSKKKADAEDVSCKFYSTDSRLLATVVSKSVTMNTQTQNLEFHGAVKARSPVGETLLVQKLRYDGGRKKFFGSGGVRMTRGTSVLTGDTLMADPSTKTLYMHGNVQVTLHSLAPHSAPATAPARE